MALNTGIGIWHTRPQLAAVESDNDEEIEMESLLSNVLSNMQKLDRSVPCLFCTCALCVHVFMCTCMVWGMSDIIIRLLLLLHMYMGTHYNIATFFKTCCPEYRGLRCVLHPSTLRSRFWVQHTSRIQNKNVSHYFVYDSCYRGAPSLRASLARVSLAVKQLTMTRERGVANSDDDSVVSASIMS